MIQSCCLHRLAAASLFLCVPALGHATEVTLFSSDFTTDETGYFELFPGEFFFPSLMAWDHSLGSPAPGSLRLEVLDGGQATAIGDCAPLDHAAAYTIRADVLPTSNGTSAPTCYASFFFYREADCGGMLFLSPIDESRSDLGWQRLAQVTGPISDPQLVSVRAALSIGTEATEFTSSCNFDNLQIAAATPSEIPTISPAGSAALAAAIALLGIVFVASRRVP